MKTREELDDLRKADLADELKALSEQLGEELSTSGTNAEMVERILAAQEMLRVVKPEPREIEITGTFQAEPESDDDLPGGKICKLTIKAKHPTGFYRCGRFWPHEGREIARSELSEKEIAALKGEKNLVVEDK